MKSECLCVCGKHQFEEKDVIKTDTWHALYCPVCVIIYVYKTKLDYENHK
jgi:hypothetical protein